MSVAIAFGMMVCAMPTRGAGEKNIPAVCFWSSEADKDEDFVSWVKIVKFFNDNLALAKQFHLFVDACYSGEVIELQSAEKTKLNMPFVIGTSVPNSKKAQLAWASDDLDPPGRLQKFDTDGAIVKKAYYFNYEAYVTKGLRNKAALPGVKTLHDDAKAAVVKEIKADDTGKYRPDPQFLSGNGADETLKVTSGNRNHAIVFGGDLARVTDKYERLDQPYLALKDLNLTSLAYYLYDRAADTRGKVDVAGSGKLANFEVALGAIKTALAGRTNMDVVTILMVGHGSRVAANELTRLNPLPNAPKQGVVLARGTNGEPFRLNIPMDAESWAELKEEVVQDDPTLVRAGRPAFYLAVSTASLSAPFAVTIGGVSLGSYTIPSNSMGAVLQVSLSDSFVQSLVLAHDGEPGLTLAFDMAAGDSMTLALEDDILFDPDYEPAMYGTGIAMGVSGINEKVALQIQSMNGMLELQWPEAVEGFRPQRKENLSSGTWFDVLMTGTNRATVPVEPGSKFFRLIKP